MLTHSAAFHGCPNPMYMTAYKVEGYSWVGGQYWTEVYKYVLKERKPELEAAQAFAFYAPDIPSLPTLVI